MNTVEFGPFRLVDPPPGQADVIRAALDAIDYPWERLTPALSKDPDKACLVKWGIEGYSQSSGLFWGGTYEIHLSDMAIHLGSRAAFVFAHEVGHLVDRATLDNDTRRALTDLFHRPPMVQIGHYNHDHPDAGHVSEGWADNDNAYPSRLNECYADQFVAAFAPRLWHGDPAMGWSQRGPRFVHWTEDHAAVRDITLARDMTPTPPPVKQSAPVPAAPEPVEKEPAMARITVGQIKDVTTKRHRRWRDIVRAVNLGLLDLDKQRRFRPGRKVTRAELAEALVRLHDKVSRAD